MPPDYELKYAPAPRTGKHLTDWMAREVRDGKPWGLWRRLHMTPRGAYYLWNYHHDRVAYTGPLPEEEPAC